jgi:hypothetical protein
MGKRHRLPDKWYQKAWRPSIAFSYITTILFDFIIFPIITRFSWTPITLSNNGIFHVSMASILSVSAYSRGQEKINTIEVPPAANTEEYVVVTEEANPNVQVNIESP